MSIRAGVIAVVALLTPGAARATPACEAVRQLVAAADTHFTGMTVRQLYRDIYEGSLIVPGFAECQIDVASYPNGLADLPPGRAVEYGCVVRFERPVPAHDFQTSLTADMQQCLNVTPVHDRGGSVFLLSAAPDHRQLRVSMYESRAVEYSVRVALTRYEAEAER